jgi:methanogenic corrinoid protein MtbC1
MNAAVRAGRTIARVASLPTDQLVRLTIEDAAALDHQSKSGGDEAASVDVLQVAIAQARALDGPGLSSTLRRAAAARGVKVFTENVAAPFMRRIGDEWHAGRFSVAQEHLATAVLHDQLLEIVRSVGPRPEAKRVVVATPPGERHAIGAAIYAATAAASGWQVVYLGADLPVRDIANAAADTRADVVALSMVYIEDTAARLEDMRHLRQVLPGVRIVVGGEGAAAIESELTAIGVEYVRQ